MGKVLDLSSGRSGTGAQASQSPTIIPCFVHVMKIATAENEEVPEELSNKTGNEGTSISPFPFSWGRILLPSVCFLSSL